MTDLQPVEREAYARIIDPEMWRAWDLAALRATLHGDTPTEAKAWANQVYGNSCGPSLAKADLILSRRPTSVGGDKALGNPEDLSPTASGVLDLDALEKVARDVVNDQRAAHASGLIHEYNEKLNPPTVLALIAKLRDQPPERDKSRAEPEAIGGAVERVKAHIELLLIGAEAMRRYADTTTAPGSPALKYPEADADADHDEQLAADLRALLAHVTGEKP